MATVLLLRTTASNSELGTSRAPITELRVAYQNMDVTPVDNNRRNGLD